MLATLVLLAAGAVWLTLRTGLPRLGGQISTSGLNAAITVDRDALGTATVHAASRADAAFALGFLHAQERYFQMDLMRRLAAGELAEVIGSAALDTDKKHRPLRLRARAAQTLATLPQEDRSILTSYAAGANAGLADLGSRPWEYWLLGTAPVQWRDADCILVMDAMFLDLNDVSNARETAFARIRQALGEKAYKLLSVPGGPWDAPLTGPPMRSPDLPTAEDIDLRKVDPALLRVPADPAERPTAPGSNGFAVSGRLTGTHAALVAGDMHLKLRVPNLWFRARLAYPSPRREGENVDLVGVTLPGVPGLVAGSNRHVAWTFTNSYGDWMDWVRVVPEADDAARDRDADGVQQLQQSEEIIKVHNGTDFHLALRDTKWGPVLGADADGTPLALAWTALQPGALNLQLLHLDTAETTDEAIDIANRTGMPPQNLVVGDRAGNIGWTIAGRIPKRIGGFDPLLPADWSRPGTGWDGWLAPEEYPRLPNPPGQRIWTANQRTLDFESADFARLGDGDYDLGARARAIREDLNARATFTPDDMLTIQLDDRAPLLQHWRQQLLDALKHADDSPLTTAMRKYASEWNGRADPASVGYRLIHDYRKEVIDTVLDGFAAAVRAQDKDFILPHLGQAETIVDAILARQPPHLLPPGYADWPDLLRKCAERLGKRLDKQSGGIAARTWGDANATRIRHALSTSLPGMGWLLDMPRRELPGDSNLPRVQAPDFGASERFAVEPGHEEYGYFHMPGGQSDNPLSPFYGAGDADWAQGKAAPFLPGATKYTFSLTPN